MSTTAGMANRLVELICGQAAAFIELNETDRMSTARLRRLHAAHPGAGRATANIGNRNDLDFPCNQRCPPRDITAVLAHTAGGIGELAIAFRAADTTVKVAVIAGVFALTGSLVAGIFTVTGALVSKQPPSPPAGSGPIPLPPPSTSLLPVCAKRVTLRAPKNGDLVDGIAGVKVIGEICGLGHDETVWIFDQDLYDQNYYLVYDPNSGPRPVATPLDVEFTIQDQPIGDLGDRLKRYIIVAVLATKGCGNLITNTKMDSEGNYVFRQLPDGCDVIDQRQILESQP